MSTDIAELLTQLIEQALDAGFSKEEIVDELEYAVFEIEIGEYDAVRK